MYVNKQQLWPLGGCVSRTDDEGEVALIEDVAVLELADVVHAHLRV